MARPVGAPFWGEALAPEDWTVLSGSADYANADGSFLVANAFAGGAAQSWGEGDGLGGDDYIRVPSAAKLLWIFDSTFTYLEPGDTVAASWAVRARGSGSMSVTNDLDPTWDYTDPASASIGTQAVSGGAWTIYDFPTTEYTVAELLDLDGGFRVAVDVTGAVDIDVIQLRIYPPGGPIGGFGTVRTDATVEIEALGETTVADQSSLPDFNPSYTDAWDEGISNYIDGVESGFTTIDQVFNVQAIDTVVSNLEGTLHDHRWFFESSYLSFDLGVASSTPYGYASGVEGVDWIRRPDRTSHDPHGAWVYADADAVPAVVGWIGDEVAYEAQKSGVEDPAAFASFGAIGYVPPAELGVERPPATPRPPAGSSTVAITVGGSGTLPLDLPLSDAFTLVAGHSWMETAPPEPDLTGNSLDGEALRATMVFSVNGLFAVVQIPPYRVWLPQRISWVQHRQRGDGLGQSTFRVRGHSTHQFSIRVRGIR